MKRFCLTAALVVLIIFARSARAEDSSSQSAVPGDIRIEQHLNEQVPLDLEFVDESGNRVRLGQYFKGRPVILTLVYYQCPMLCNVVLTGLTNSLSDLRFDIGKEFDVITVSFDSRETPAMAAEKKATFVRHYVRAGAREGWHFLTGEGASIKRLADAVGFKYRYDSATGQFAHAAGIMILTPQGKLSRYFYGIEYPARDLRLGLVEASANKIGSPVDQLLLLCFHYDPTTGKYTAIAVNSMRAGGVVTLAALAAFVLVMLRKDWNRKPKNPLRVE